MDNIKIASMVLAECKNTHISSASYRCSVFTLHTQLFIWSRQLRLWLTKRSTTWPQKPATWPHLKQAVFLSSSVPDLSPPFRPHSCNFPISINLQPRSVNINKRPLVPRKRRDKFLILHSNTNPVNNHVCNSRNEGLETSKHYKLHNLFPEDRIQYHRPIEPWRRNCATLLVAFQQTCYMGIYNPSSSSTAVHGWIIHWYRDTTKRCRAYFICQIDFAFAQLTSTTYHHHHMTDTWHRSSNFYCGTEMSRPGRANHSISLLLYVLKDDTQIML